MAFSSFSEGNYHVLVFDSLDQELTMLWEENAPSTLTVSYLKLIQESNPVDLKFRYVFIKKNIDLENKVVGLLYFQDLKSSPKNISFRNNKLLSALTSLLLFVRPFRMSICGNLFAVNFPSIWFNANYIGKEQVLDIVIKVDANKKSDILIIKDLDSSFDASLTAQYKLEPYPFDLTMALNINKTWATFDSYVKALSKKYRKRAEKIIKSGEKIIRKNLEASDILSSSKRILQLFNNVANKQSVRMGLVGQNYFFEYKKRFPDLFTFQGYYYKDSLIGFATYIDHGSTLEMHYIGIDYSLNTELSIYFNMLFDGVRMSIENKKDVLELGRTAREAKANLGAIPVYFNDYIAVKNKFIKSLVNRFGNNFQREMGEGWKERHPFIK